MTRRFLTRWALLATPLFLLAGCSHQNDLAHLRAFVADGPKTNTHIEPLPAITHYAPVSYENPLNRDPFTSFSERMLREEAANQQGEKVPRPRGPSTPLEDYDLGSLSLTGILQGENGQYWGVFATPDGKVYRASIGDGIGNKDGHITAIDPKQRTVTVLQYLPNAFGGFSKQNSVIQMQNPA